MTSAMRPLSIGTTAPRLQSYGRTGWVAAALSLPGLLWFALWFSINSGPWVLDRVPRTAMDEVHYFRTLGPLIALAVATLVLLARSMTGPHRLRPLPRALWPWMLYGVIALLACATSPNPARAVYWALSYLSAFIVLWLFIQAPTKRETLDRCRQLNYLSWAIAVGLLLFVVYVSRDALFVAGPGGLSGYGIVNRFDPGGGVAMVRSSGIARFAAVPAIFAFVALWSTVGLKRVIWATVFAGSATLVYLMQSRGATLGLAGALGLAIIIMGRRSRAVGVVLLLCVAAAMWSGFELGSESEEITRHLTRTDVGFRRDVTSGRTQDWATAWEQIQTSPLWGWGPQADRYLLRFHVHNSYLYAWLAAGLIGLALFAVGMVWAWRLVLKATRSGVARQGRNRVVLVQTGCILGFFTIRSIPEVSGAMFGIDLLLMLPALAWLDALHRFAPGAGGANAGS